MIDPTQILLFAVVITLTILLVIIGWQIYKILAEIYKIVARFNAMIDDASTVAKNLGKSLENISGFSEGLKIILSIIHLLSKKKGGKDEQRKK